MKQLPFNLVEKYFNIYAGQPKKLAKGDLNGGCWHCREGKSWGKKQRLWYLPDKDLIYCFNCNMSWSPVNWIKQVSGLNYKEILEEANGFDHFYSEDAEEVFVPAKKMSTLPLDSINLSDPVQVKYYGDSYVVQEALKIIRERKLDTCANSTELYISLKDYVHKNRICIPFKDSDNKIRFYQTRAIFPNDAIRAKYLSKANSEKTIFGLNKIDPEFEFLLITEGPIDSMFITKNGVSMAGLTVTDHQKSLLCKYITFQKVWILDNQLDNEDVVEKYQKLIDQNERVFIWPEKYKAFKDINELCCKVNLNSIKPEFFIDNSYVGLNATLRLNKAITR